MSQENVEIAKRAIGAFNRRDVEGFFALTVSDFEWFPAMAGTVEGGGYRGRGGIEAYLADIGEAWEEYRVLAEEFRDLEDRVVWRMVTPAGSPGAPGAPQKPTKSCSRRSRSPCR